MHRTQRRRDTLLLGLGTVAAFLIIWEAAPALGLVRPMFTSSPSRVIGAAGWLFANGFAHDIATSAVTFLIGFGLAVLTGVPLGIVLGWFPLPRAMLGPFITALYATPRVALLPLLILWLGIGLVSTVAIVYLGAVFPIIITVMSGMRALDDQLIRCARAFAASDRKILTSVAMSASLPFIIAGMRLGVGRGLVGVVVGELVGANAGVGHMMSIAGATFQTDKVFVGVLVLTIGGLLLTATLSRLERRFDRWRPER